MNILFIGPYRQKDGWGLASRDYIKAIASLEDINLSTRPIYLAPGNTDENFNDNEILQYENNFFSSYDMVIQKVLPEYMFYDGRFGKNIGLFTLEICNYKHTQMVRNLNRMDEIWVPSEIERDTLIKSGVYKTIRVISQPILLPDNLPAQDKLFREQINNTFKLYTVCENNFRKNLEDLIIGFSLAFDPIDDVSLIIKTTGNHNELVKWSQEIKNGLRLNKKSNPEIFITNRLNDNEMIRLHSACDCFVSTSYGEAFCRPAAEALCLGKCPIVNKNTGMKDFINSENGFLVKSYKTPVIIPNSPISGNQDYYNANQYWYKIDIYDLVAQMKTAYNLYKNDKKAWQDKCQIGIEQKDKFSYKNIGNKLCIKASK